MLTKLDETLRHQLPTTFDHVGTSDPRFYDRYWFCAYDPDGALSLIAGMGLYANMNVLDGFVAVQQGANPDVRQHNLRVSRALRPEVDDMRVGPLAIDVIEPFTRARVRCASGEAPLAVDLEWCWFLPPKEEDHHFARLRGRVTQDYRRYTQVGRMSGTISVDGVTYEARDWFGARDHSWGVRPQTAGREPVTGPPDSSRAERSFCFYWLPFATDELGGHVQFHLLDGAPVYMDGVVQWPDGREVAIVDATLDVDLHPGTRRFRRSRSVWTGADGATLEVVTEPLQRCWSMDGTGYDWGWDDGFGLGIYRGERFEEVDVYDLSHPEDVVRPDGSVRRPRHRETPVRVTVDGRPGTGHQVLMLSGSVGSGPLRG